MKDHVTAVLTFIGCFVLCGSQNCSSCSKFCPFNSCLQQDHDYSTPYGQKELQLLACQMYPGMFLTTQQCHQQATMLEDLWFDRFTSSAPLRGRRQATSCCRTELAFSFPDTVKDISGARRKLLHAPVVRQYQAIYEGRCGTNEHKSCGCGTCRTAPILQHVLVMNNRTDPPFEFATVVVNGYCFCNPT